MKHSVWFKRLFNPILRKIWKVEITSLCLPRVNNEICNNIVKCTLF